MRRLLCVLAAVVISACGGSPVAAVPSPGSLAASTVVGSHGSLFFVTDNIGWEVTEPPDGLRMVILRTDDAGGHWRLWGIAPEPGSPIAFTATEVVLTYQAHLLRSSDGSHWTIQTMPGDVATVSFLPDLMHGWEFGFLPPATTSSTPTAAGKGGVPPGNSSGGKGGAGARPGVCQDKGCVPTAIWSTSDGGASWRMVSQSTWGQSAGSLYFWSPNNGMIASGLSLQLTHDSGATWHPVQFAIAGIGSDQPANDLAPTMFDASHGVLPIQVANALYISRTSDGGLTWTAPVAINNCVSCGSGQLAFLDDQHWVSYSTDVYFTGDSGVSWKREATTNPGKATSDVEVLRSPAPTVIVVAPGIFASATSDWGVHWHAVGLPDTYPSYKGFDGAGGWSG
jgi:photosystem II stability/assembly factor-like uncharacterized protein